MVKKWFISSKHCLGWVMKELKRICCRTVWPPSEKLRKCSFYIFWFLRVSAGSSALRLVPKAALTLWEGRLFNQLCRSLCTAQCVSTLLWFFSSSTKRCSRLCIMGPLLRAWEQPLFACWATQTPLPVWHTRLFNYRRPAALMALPQTRSEKVKSYFFGVGNVYGWVQNSFPELQVKYAIFWWRGSWRLVNDDDRIYEDGRRGLRFSGSIGGLPDSWARGYYLSCWEPKVLLISNLFYFHIFTSVAWNFFFILQFCVHIAKTDTYW